MPRRLLQQLLIGFLEASCLGLVVGLPNRRRVTNTTKQAHLAKHFCVPAMTHLSLTKTRLFGTCLNVFNNEPCCCQPVCIVRVIAPAAVAKRWLESVNYSAIPRRRGYSLTSYHSQVILCQYKYIFALQGFNVSQLFKVSYKVCIHSLH